MANYGQLTVDRRLMTLAALRLLDRPASITDVLRVLQAVHADGKWPQGSQVNEPYYTGVTQHLWQMRQLEWVDRHAEDERLWVLGSVQPTIPPLPVLPLRYRISPRPVGQREIPPPTRDPEAAKKICPVCRRGFQSEAWTCGDPVCAELVAPAPSLLGRVSRLQSEAISILLDVDIRRGQRFVLVQTGRGEWRVNVQKYETWETAVDRALA